jgi:hypothetical protein
MGCRTTESAGPSLKAGSAIRRPAKAQPEVTRAGQEVVSIATKDLTRERKQDSEKEDEMLVTWKTARGQQGREVTSPWSFVSAAVENRRKLLRTGAEHRRGPGYGRLI